MSKPYYNTSDAYKRRMKIREEYERKLKDFQEKKEKGVKEWNEDYRELLKIGKLKKIEEQLKAFNIKEKKEENRFPYKLPAGTQWKNIVIKFLDEETVSISVGRYYKDVIQTFEEMGFVDKRFSSPRPNEAWKFLKVLAINNGEITFKDKKAKLTYKKQKELLAKQLQSYFRMESDPFYPYHETKSYRARFIIFYAPEELKRDEKKQEETETEEDEIDEEIKQFLNEQAPQVWEE